MIKKQWIKHVHVSISFSYCPYAVMLLAESSIYQNDNNSQHIPGSGFLLPPPCLGTPQKDTGACSSHRPCNAAWCWNFCPCFMLWLCLQFKGRNQGWRKRGRPEIGQAARLPSNPRTHTLELVAAFLGFAE